MVFFLIPYENIYKVILGRSFIAKLDFVASLDHLKIKYHKDAGKIFLVNVDMCEAHLIYEAMLKTSLASTELTNI